MSSFINLIKDYYMQNKYIVLVYLTITVVFYVSNFFFFSDSIDLPPDIIFIALYIIVSPGLVSILTVSRSKVLLLNSNSNFYTNIIIHSLIVIVFNFVCLNVYEIFRISQGYWESSYKVVLFSIPVIVYSMIVAFEFKLRFENILKKLGIVLILLISWYIVDIFFNDLETLHIYRTITYLYLFILPILAIVFWYRKKLVD